MSETKYESKITSAPCSAQQIYRVMSNLQNLERVRDMIPKDKIQEMEIEPDRVRIKVDGLAQKITIAIVDRIENDTVFQWMPISGFSSRSWRPMIRVSN